MATAIQSFFLGLGNLNRIRIADIWVRKRVGDNASGDNQDAGYCDASCFHNSIPVLLFGERPLWVITSR